MSARGVTFVIATYRRADALRCTLRSLVLQDHDDWAALVVGDGCGPETEAAVRSVADPRIRYWNLRGRFGEQSGPNTFGLALATGSWTVFLNHDDLLLRDHLTRGIAAAEAARAEVFVARSADATRLNVSGAVVTPVFTRLLPRTEDLRHLVLPDPYVLDPSSFWLVRTDFAKSVGPWRPARTLRRTPLRDWLLRAWRRGGAIRFGDAVTGLRFWTQNLRKDGPLYAHATPEHETMLRRMESEPVESLRASILEQVRGAETGVAKDPEWSAPRIAAAAFLWRRLGIDAVAVASRLRGEPPGAVLGKVTRKRLGEDLPDPPRVEEFLSDPEAWRVV